MLAYFFGGGWVLGSLETAEPVCRRLANAAECAVVSIAYRRAPEHPFPAAVEDCYAATCWLAENGDGHGLDATRLAVGGASSGGNLAAAVAMLARDRSGPSLAFQLLVYPPLDHRAATPSRREPVERPFFGPEDVAWCWSHYLADPADGESPSASPLRAGDLGGLPPALVITAEFDPLRDEGELYAARLREAGVPTELVALRRRHARLLLARRRARRRDRGAGARRLCAATGIRRRENLSDAERAAPHRAAVDRG